MHFCTFSKATLPLCLCFSLPVFLPASLLSSDEKDRQTCLGLVMDFIQLTVVNENNTVLGCVLLVTSLFVSHILYKEENKF